MRYAFIKDNQHTWQIRRLCLTLGVHHSGLKKQLIPELPSNSVIVLDNAIFHKSNYLKEIDAKNDIEVLFLPP